MTETAGADGASTARPGSPGEGGPRRQEGIRGGGTKHGIGLRFPPTGTGVGARRRQRGARPHPGSGSGFRGGDGTLPSRKAAGPRDIPVPLRPDRIDKGPPHRRRSHLAPSKTFVAPFRRESGMTDPAMPACLLPKALRIALPSALQGTLPGMNEKKMKSYSVKKVIRWVEGDFDTCKNISND